VLSLEERRDKVRKAKLFAVGAFVILLLQALYCLGTGDVFNAIYFGSFSTIFLGLYFYIRSSMSIVES